MKRTTTCTLAAAAAALVFCCRLPARAEGPGPRLVPAEHAAHATRAGMLGITQAGSRLVAVGVHGVILLSDDGGRQWRQAAAVPVDCTLTAVSFADDRHGWAAGHCGVILATGDGGETWTVQRSAVQEDRPLFALHMFDAQHGVAVGLWSLILRTDNGGANWQPVAAPKPEGAAKGDLNLLGLFAGWAGEVYAPGERGMLLHSADQGRSWSYLATGYKGSLWTGTVLRSGVLLAAGLRGSLYRSTDGGREWTRIAVDSKSSITALAARGDEVLAVGLDGLSLRSTDGGATFDMAVRADHAALTGALLLPGGRAVLASRRGMASEP